MIPLMMRLRLQNLISQLSILQLRSVFLKKHKKMDDNVPRKKRGKPIGSKDAGLRKKKGEKSGTFIYSRSNLSLERKQPLKWLKPMKRSMIPGIQKSRSITVMIFEIEMI